MQNTNNILTFVRKINKGQKYMYLLFHNDKYSNRLQQFSVRFNGILSKMAKFPLFCYVIQKNLIVDSGGAFSNFVKLAFLNCEEALFKLQPFTGLCYIVKKALLSYLLCSIIWRSSTKIVQIMPLGSKLTLPGGHQFYIDL